MKKGWLPWVLEALGIRLFYRVIGAITGDRQMRWRGQPTHTAMELEDLIRDSRYYNYANFFRGALYVAPAIKLRELHAWPAFSLLAFLIVFHALSVLLEFYRTNLAQAQLKAGHVLDERLRKEKIAASVAVDHWWFAPKPIESEKLYMALGFEYVRKIVLWYTDTTKLSLAERRAGLKAPPKKAQLDMDGFERDTRTGELLHGSAGLLNIPALVTFLLMARWLWAGYILLIFVLDMALMFLQRYHRTRVYAVWVKGDRLAPVQAQREG